MIAIDLFCGLGGWAEGLLAEGYEVVGFDIERHQYGAHRYPAHLVIQDVLTLHGSQFRDAALIVASPPCQEYSYMAMPWKLAKAKAAAIRADTTGQKLADLNRLFEACFRIQAQASLAAGRHIPMVVENVRGAQPWVGRARWNFGSYYLWGDVPALMPNTWARKVAAPHLHLGGGNSFLAHGRDAARHDPRHAERRAQEASGQKVPQRIVRVRDGAPHTKHLTNGAEHAGIKNAGCFDGSGRSFQSASVREGFKTAGMNWSDRTLRGQDFTRIAGNQANGTKNGNDWFGAGNDCSEQRRHGSKSGARKEASALIAKIPEALSRHIAAVYR